MCCSYVWPERAHHVQPLQHRVVLGLEKAGEKAGNAGVSWVSPVSLPCSAETICASPAPVGADDPDAASTAAPKTRRGSPGAWTAYSSCKPRRAQTSEMMLMSSPNQRTGKSAACRRTRAAWGPGRRNTSATAPRMVAIGVTRWPRPLKRKWEQFVPTSGYCVSAKAAKVHGRADCLGEP